MTVAISEEMDRQGVSKADLARRMDKTRGHITQLLAGGRNLTLASIKKMADAIDCKIELRVVPHGRPKRPRVDRTKAEGRERGTAAAKA